MKRQVWADHKIIQEIRNSFFGSTGLLVQGLPPVLEAGALPDVRIEISANKETWLFPAIVMTSISPATIGIAIGRLSPFLSRGLLLTRYVTPVLADELRKRGVQFLDTVGNTYLNAPPLFVFVKGNRPDATVGAEKLKRAFKSSGL